MPQPTARTRRARKLVAAALYLSLVALSLVGAIGGSGGRSVSVLCSSIEELCQEWADGFTRRSGIPVIMVRLSTGEALARLSRPEGLREFDVWHGGPADSYVLAARRGLLAPYHSPQADAVAGRYKDPGGAFVGVYLGVLGFCSDRSALERLGLGIPNSWDDLLNPTLQHRISMPSPLSSGTGYTAVWSQRYRLGSVSATETYLTALDANVLQYTASGMAPAGIVARGEAAIAVTFTQHCVREIERGHGDLAVSYPREGTGYEVGAVAVLAQARDVAAARAYVDYAVSKEGQLAGAGRWPTQLPTRDDLPSDPRLGTSWVLGYSPEQAADGRAALIAQVRPLVER
jgi:iron(III) transport system substrate-binding protein